MAKLFFELEPDGVDVWAYLDLVFDSCWKCFILDEVEALSLVILSIDHLPEFLELRAGTSS